MSQQVAIPHSPEAEAALVSMLLNEAPELLPKAKAQALTADLFYLPGNRILFDAAHEMTSEGIAIDLASLHCHLENRKQLDAIGGASAIVEAFNAAATSANFNHYAGILRNLKAKRELIEVATKATNEAGDRAGSPEETLKMLTEAAERITGTLSPRKPYKLATEACGEFIRTYEADYGEGSAGIATGITALDTHTGGLKPDQFTVIGGKTSGGKSVLSLQFAAAVLTAGKPVLVFSLEMSAREVFARLVSHLGRIPMDAITLNRKPNKGEIAAMKKHCAHVEAFPLAISDEAGITMAHVEAYSQQFADQHGQEIGLIVVDYIQLLEGGREKGETREQEISRYSRALKRLSKKHHCPVITPSQLNDDGRLRESRAIGQDADNVFIILDDSILISKNRNGRREVTVKAKLNGLFQTFEEH
ncbi:replicative DNA helicase [Roseibacillus ishigakijimensis]|uniref:DNA 5'-3' helicase n=1 Tax=Roseibacillus ishigakijimensis TaxID=454146 RepID=A0A934VNS9_9BACT|nr:DnaB-like helicase C-terminal domain-containing protein [Roseibacillus ishigakijimensis]MBK1835381.1 AAA family ATPase [Roseibacillus ishigakijimensis]